MRGAEDARAGRVEIVAHDGARVEARVDGDERREDVQLDLSSLRPREFVCTCPDFLKGGTCRHLWAVLAVVTGAVPPGARGSRSESWKTWIEELERLEELAGGSAEAADEEACRIDYVLVLDDSASAASTVLEARRAKPLARGGFGKPSAFALLAPPKGVQLGAEDRRVAALLRGASSLTFAGELRSKAETRYYLDAEQSAALLPVLAATNRLSWSRRGTVARGSLTLDAGETWKPCLVLEDAGEGLLKLTARLERGSERVPAADVRGVLAGDFVVLDGRLVRASLGLGRAWFLNTLATPPPPFAREEAPRILHEIARRGLDAEPGAGLEDLIAARRPVPQLVLSIPTRTDGRFGHVPGRIELDYGVARVSPDDRRPLLPTGRGVLRRYPGIEDVLLERTLALGALRRTRGTLAVPIERVPELVRGLAAEGWSVSGEGAKWRALGNLRISLSSGIDWFELEGRIEGAPVGAFPALLAALERGESTVALGDGTIGVLPEEWVARWQAALALGAARGGKLRFGAHQAWLVDLLLSERLEDFVDQESRRLWQEQKQRLADFEHVAPVHEPAGFRGELRPYQREGLGWLEFLARHRFGGCLADDMGLGKTVQVLAYLQARKERAERRAPTLIVAPKSLTHNWLEEARRFTPGLSVVEYVGTERARLRAQLECHDLVLTTYGTARVDIEFLAQVEFAVVVLDESQAIKNEDSRTARSVRLLRAEQRLALSGTPIENHLGELWSLFEFLNPGLLGRSSTFQGLLGASEGGQADRDTLTLVAGAVRPFLLRRTKEEVLRDLPERTELTVACDMEDEQRAAYVELRDHFRRTLLGKNEAELRAERLVVLEMLLRLRQAACHPGLFDPARADAPCAKFDALFPMLDEVLETGHKALVFSQFTSFLALVRRRLDAEKRPYGYLDGSTPAKKRAEEVARFQEDPTQKLFLLSLKAGGTGLNLTAADYVFLLDPWWNPAVEAQAIGRSHRIGQTRNVFAYRLVCRDTIEERVLELQERKRELANAVLEGDGTLLRELTREDLERLLA
jgi:superfamily II DNA or RNA helicase